MRTLRQVISNPLRGFRKSLLAALLLSLCGAWGFRGAAQTRRETFHLYFPHNSAVLSLDYKDNLSSSIQLDSFLRASALVDSVLVVATTSPEGAVRFNLDLSRRRADAARRFLLSRYPELSDRLVVRHAGEDWDLFREALMADLQIPDGTRLRMLDIIDSDTPYDTKERMLRSLPTWRRLFDLHFPLSRVATITVLLSDFPGLESVGAILDTPLWIPAPEALHLTETPVVIPALTRTRTLRPVFGLSTNLLYDFTYIPNYGFTSIPSLSLEYYPRRSRHFTFGVDVEWPMWKHWQDHRFFQINQITLWTRRYFKPQQDRFRGLYMSLGIQGARFGIGWDAKGWEGEGLGAAVGLGWKCIFGKSRFYLDLGLTAGAFFARYDPYVYGFDTTQRYYYDYAGEPDLFVERNHRLFWAGPTRVYISLGIDLFNRKRR